MRRHRARGGEGGRCCPETTISFFAPTPSAEQRVEQQAEEQIEVPTAKAREPLISRRVVADKDAKLDYDRQMREQLPGFQQTARDTTTGHETPLSPRAMENALNQPPVKDIYAIVDACGSRYVPGGVGFLCAGCWKVDGRSSSICMFRRETDGAAGKETSQGANAVVGNSAIELTFGASACFGIFASPAAGHHAQRPAPTEPARTSCLVVSRHLPRMGQAQSRATLAMHLANMESRNR